MFEWSGEGKLMEMIRKSGAGREQWSYRYDTLDGSKGREEYRVRGALEKVTVYTDARARVEELYQGGALFLKVFYIGDTRVKEQVYERGTLLRERSF
jgi:hypothetical protein